LKSLKNQNKLKMPLNSASGFLLQVHLIPSEE
jgi:hypothetical protein